jgi:hypothetical protein
VCTLQTPNFPTCHRHVSDSATSIPQTQCLQEQPTDCVCRLINYCNSTKDYMVPSVWGQVRLSRVGRLAHGKADMNHVPRSTNAKIHMLPNNQVDAVRSCNRNGECLWLHKRRSSGVTRPPSSTPSTSPSIPQPLNLDLNKSPVVQCAIPSRWSAWQLG